MALLELDEQQVLAEAINKQLFKKALVKIFAAKQQELIQKASTTLNADPNTQDEHLKNELLARKYVAKAQAFGEVLGVLEIAANA